MSFTKPRIGFICRQCSKRFEVSPGRAKQKPRFCDVKCYGKYLKKQTPWNKGITAKQDPRLATGKRHGMYGKRTPRWNGGRFIDQGYVFVWSPKHPESNRGYVREHRLIMEKTIGRYLTNDEVVHHINGIKTDNRIENLLLLSASEHSRLHHEQKGHKIDARSSLQSNGLRQSKPYSVPVDSSR